MSTFRHFYKSLCGDVPKLSEPKAAEIINEAYRQILDSHLWSFLLEQSYIVIPAQITTGTMSVVRGSNKVTPNISAKALLDSFGLLPPLTDCILRIGSGQPYEISAYDSSLGSDNIALSQPYLEATNPSAAYSIYRAYFSPPLSIDSLGQPVLDFLRFKLLHNRSQGYRPIQSTTQHNLNLKDPQRLSYGEALQYAPFRHKSITLNTDDTTTKVDIPLFEFWPHPTSSRNLFCIYQKKGLPLSDDGDTLPSPLTQQLLLSRARALAYEWADSHKGEFKEQLLSVNWLRKISDLADPRRQDSYPYLLGLAIKQDREIFLSSMLSNYYFDIYAYSSIPGGNWYQNHAVSLY